MVRACSVGPASPPCPCPAVASPGCDGATGGLIGCPEKAAAGAAGTTGWRESDEVLQLSSTLGSALVRAGTYRVARCNPCATSQNRARLIVRVPEPMLNRADADFHGSLSGAGGPPARSPIRARWIFAPEGHGARGRSRRPPGSDIDRSRTVVALEPRWCPPGQWRPAWAWTWGLAQPLSLRALDVCP